MPSNNGGSLFLVTTYTDNDVLAHIPTGSPGRGLYTYRLCVETGALVPLEEYPVGPNPAFILKHPSRNILYATTECIDKDGEILTLEVSSNGKLNITDRQSACGRSTCYLNFHKTENSEDEYISAVNYWDSKVATFPLEDGRLHNPCDIKQLPGATYVTEKNPSREEHWSYRQRYSASLPP